MDNVQGTYAWNRSGRIEAARAAGKDLAAALQLFGNMGLRQDERLPGDSYDPFVRPASRVWRQLALDCGGDVSPNDGEVAVLKFEDIRAAVQARAFHAAQMRVGTKSA